MACLASRNATICDKCRLEPGPEPHGLRNGRSSLAQSRSWLEMVARAWCGTASAPRNGRSSLAWSCSWLEMAARAWPRAAAGSRNDRSSLAWNCSWLEMVARAWPRAASASRNGRSSLAQRRSWFEIAARACRGTAESSTGAARICSRTAKCSIGALRTTAEVQNARREPLEPALAPQHARKVPLAPIAARCVRCLRSKCPLQECWLVFVYHRHHFFLGSTLLRACYARVHISIYIYVCILDSHMALDGACGVARSTARINAEFETERF